MTLRQHELAATITEEPARLQRVAVLLDDMERGSAMRSIDVAVRTSDRMRIAVTRGSAPGYGFENVGPVFAARMPIVRQHLMAANVRPGIGVGHFDWPDEEGRVMFQLGFEIGDQPLDDSAEVHVAELPAATVACALHRGPMTTFTDTFRAVVHWIDANGYEISDRSRELYHTPTSEDPGATVVELQIPVRERTD